ncbi:MAG: hypothetical protein ACRDYW_05230 [Acidimicrobiales bacterium]
MHRITPPLVAVLVAVGALAPACNGDDEPAASTTTEASTSTTAGADEELSAHLLDVGDLPPGFEAATEVDDTITTFCANEDATAGLQASAREVRGFTRTGGGASVLQVAIRFDDDGATRFVDQASAILDRCSDIPDATGLAFTYEPLTAGLEAPVAERADALIGRHGVNVGSGQLSIDLVVLRTGDVGQLVAVLGLDLPREDLDSLAAAAFEAVARRLPG